MIDDSEIQKDETQGAGKMNWNKSAASTQIWLAGG